MAEDESQGLGLRSKVSPPDKAEITDLPIPEVLQRLEREIPAEERQRMDAEVRERTILDFRAGALRWVAAESGWLENYVHLLKSSLSAFQESRGQTAFEAVCAVRVVINVRQVHIALGEIKLHIAEYREATKQGGSTEREPETFTVVLTKIEEYIIKTEGEVFSPEIVQAEEVLKANAQELAKLPYYTESLRPLAPPKPLTQDRIAHLKDDMRSAARFAFEDTGQPPSSLVTKVFANEAYRDWVAARTLEQIKP